MSVERDLQDALRRPEPPADFADRVMERIAAERARGYRSVTGARQIRAAAAMLILLLGAGGWAGYRMEQNRRAERAAGEAIAALRITSEKLNLAKQNMEIHSAE